MNRKCSVRSFNTWRKFFLSLASFKTNRSTISVCVLISSRILFFKLTDIPLIFLRVGAVLFMSISSSERSKFG